MFAMSSFFVKAFFYRPQSVPTTANYVLFILDLIGYNNLIRHSNSKNMNVLLLSLLEDKAKTKAKNKLPNY